MAKTSEEPVGGGGVGGSTLRREQQEQKRLLADTHTVAMDLRCRLEHCERGWLRERSELLERFNLERKEWESQLRDMQRKIEEVSGETYGSSLAKTAQMRLMIAVVSIRQKRLLLFRLGMLLIGC